MSKKELKNLILEKKSNELYNRYFNCVQVNIMNLGKIDKAIRVIILSSNDIDKDMKNLVSSYRVN